MNRIRTDISGLDLILNGGLFEGGVYILEGPPGVGKTTLANQFAYAGALRGTSTLYVTMLAESHARMLQHMSGQSFFRRQAVNAQVYYVSGYRELDQEGLQGVVRLLGSELARSGARILVIDGLVVESRRDTDGKAVRRFVHELQSLMAALNCVCLLLTSGDAGWPSAEQTMVDGILAFEEFTYQWRAERRMQVRKFRGSEVTRGRHTYCISDRGLVFFPRFEAMPFEDREPPRGPRYLPSGIGPLDSALAEGGLAEGSSAVVTGAGGSGKTSLCLAFAAASTIEGPCVYLASTESRGALRRQAAVLSLDLDGALDAGALVVEPLGRRDESLDEMAYGLLRLVDEHKARRLVVDGLAGLADTLAFPERSFRFVGRLLAELRVRGVISLFTLDNDEMTAAAGTPFAGGLTGWFDHLFELTAGRPEADSRALTIRKVRASMPASPLRFEVQVAR